MEQLISLLFATTKQELENRFENYVLALDMFYTGSLMHDKVENGIVNNHWWMNWILLKVSLPREHSVLSIEKTQMVDKSGETDGVLV